ncbi:iron(III) transport system permease protein [Butyrivibrio sp. Su6]|jgi:iron(III) transport system permease protein|uniref:ABC transporter permease n=1 Tax=Butyrivibrio sp. Su6 TaxID=1520810 RepID=UPI00089EF66E|nr:iron ABC transporter permease [Butyrivibrio sp. Su6]SEG03623.1 iron(III) transport system permease protein [Butyrivibrio sp. Su6]
MAKSQSASLDRKKLMADPIMVSTIVLLIVFLTVFILYPLAILLVDSFISESGFTLDTFKRVMELANFRRAITNTLKVGFLVGIASALIGLLFAYVEVYVKLRTKFMEGLFKVVSMLPVVSPPFVLSLSMIMLFGKAGIITRFLLKIYDNSVYGFWGIAIVQTLTFFPVCYMMLKGLLKNIDPSLEEAARDMGASRFKVFMTVTLPLILPGLGNAFLVTFIESIADFANPMIIGGSYDTLATTIYLQITGAYDKQGAAAMAVVLLAITLVMFIVQKYYLEAKSTATLSGKASRERMLITDKSVTVPLTILCSALAIFVIIMYICVPFGAMFRTWGYDFHLTFKWFGLVFSKYKGLKAFKDSFILSLISAPITALLSMIISYLVVKRKFKAKGFIEAVSMLAMAVPGTVLGIGYIRGFSGGLFGTGILQGLYGTGAILVIVFIVRSLPTGTRSGISALRQIDKSIEESAYDMGADSFKVFMTVTLPLIKDSFLSGFVTSFVRSITAISAIILLVTPSYLLITVQINEFAEKGSYGIACAFATILICITYGAVLIMNMIIKRFGTSKRVME